MRGQAPCSRGAPHSALHFFPPTFPPPPLAAPTPPPPSLPFSSSPLSSSSFSSFPPFLFPLPLLFFIFLAFSSSFPLFSPPLLLFLFLSLFFPLSSLSPLPLLLLCSPLPSPDATRFLVSGDRDTRPRGRGGVEGRALGGCRCPPFRALHRNEFFPREVTLHPPPPCLFAQCRHFHTSLTLLLSQARLASAERPLEDRLRFSRRRRRRARTSALGPRRESGGGESVPRSRSVCERSVICASECLLPA